MGRARVFIRGRSDKIQHLAIAKNEQEVVYKLRYIAR